MAERTKGSVIFKYLSEDFIVEELGEDERSECKISSSTDVFNGAGVDFGKLDVLDRRLFLMCDLEKIDLDHFTAMSILCRALSLAPHQIGYAGTKDKKAWTCQRITLFNPDIAKVSAFRHQGIFLKNFKWVKHKLKIGDLLGNRFTVVLRDADTNALKILSRIKTNSEIPNLFGMQRFGSLRNDNVLIGKLILKRKFEDAVFAFLVGAGESENAIVREAKKRLIHEKDLNAARDFFPSKLHLECKILDYLSMHPGDWVGALKLIDEKVIALMCQSVQSQIFNEVLEYAIDEGLPLSNTTIPLIGSTGKFSPGRIGRLQERVFESHGLSLANLSVPQLPAASLKNSTRDAFFKVRLLEVETADDELFLPSKKVILKFMLDSGVYATTFLEYFFTLLTNHKANV
ncbi:tRNA pseudouridine(13) synthase TruD [Candidatus Pacearchaeota archaeon]|nr:tRNA pseudouridine(13) synthase TruD [Candidatus Pacearchaeota archaeon]